MTAKQLLKKLDAINAKSIKDKHIAANKYLDKNALYAGDTMFRYKNKTFKTYSTSVQLFGRTVLIVYNCICVHSNKTSDIGKHTTCLESIITKSLNTRK